MGPAFGPNEHLVSIEKTGDDPVGAAASGSPRRMVVPGYNPARVGAQFAGCADTLSDRQPRQLHRRPVIGAGALLAGAAGTRSALETLSKAIRVDLTNPDFRYALVTLRRKDGIAAHASAESGILVHARPRAPDAAYGLNPDFIRAHRIFVFHSEPDAGDSGEGVSAKGPGAAICPICSRPPPSCRSAC
jgi:hypothetical protein